MAISGIETINVGLENETLNSDSLFTAFTKTRNNFVLLASASPFSTFNAGVGVSISTNATTGNVNISSNVAGIVAGDASITVTSNPTTGVYTIVAPGGGGGGTGTVTQVGILPVSTSRLSVVNSPIITSGNISIDLAPTGAVAGAYTNPSMSVDSYGRVTTIANGAASGSVTSVGLVPGGFGIGISGGPITSAGSITITNTGVTKISAGTGISVTGSGSGNVTISTTVTGNIGSIGVVSTSGLVISGSPLTTSGTISVDLPADLSIIGNITCANISTTGQLRVTSSENLVSGAAANTLTAVSYFATSGASVATLAAGVAFQVKTFVMTAYVGDMVITVTNAGWKTSGTGTITFTAIGSGCQLQYLNNKWYCVGNNSAIFG